MSKVRKDKNFLNLDSEKNFLLSGYDAIVGIDEVGRGCIAGPVCVCGFYVDFSTIYKLENLIYQSNCNFVVYDSKKLTKVQRNISFKILKEFKFLVKYKSNIEIDKFGIVFCINFLIKEIINEYSNVFSSKRILFLVDGIFKENFGLNVLKIIKGDAKYFSIAASSIIAKVSRDDLMRNLSQKFPIYDWENNVGYGTKKHYKAIEKYGLSEYHRNSFVI